MRKMVSRSRIWGTRRKALSELEGLLEIMDLEMTMKSVRPVHIWTMGGSSRF